MHPFFRRVLSLSLSFSLLILSVCASAQHVPPADFKEIQAQMRKDAARVEESAPKGLWKRYGGWLVLGGLLCARYVIEVEIYRPSGRVFKVKFGESSSNRHRHKKERPSKRIFSSETSGPVQQKAAAPAHAAKGNRSGPGAIAGREAADVRPALPTKLPVKERILDVGIFAEKFEYPVQNAYRSFGRAGAEGKLYSVRPGYEENFLKAVREIVNEELDRLPPEIQASVVKGDGSLITRRTGVVKTIHRRISSELTGKRLRNLVVPVKVENMFTPKLLGRVGKWGARLAPAALLAWAACSAQNESEAKMARRLQENWSLILDASEEEGLVIQKSPRLMQACGEIAKELGMLADMDPVLRNELFAALIQDQKDLQRQSALRLSQELAR